MQSEPSTPRTRIAYRGASALSGPCLRHALPIRDCPLIIPNLDHMPLGETVKLMLQTEHIDLWAGVEIGAGQLVTAAIPEHALS